MDIEAHPRQLNRASTDVDQTPSSQVAQIHGQSSLLALAIRNMRGNCILVVAPVQQLDNGAKAWTRVQDLVQTESNAHQLESWMQKLVAKKIVGTASVRQV